MPPYKKATNSKMKQFSKPWLTQGLLKSIKWKQRMYKSHFFSNNSMKIREYKQYSNLLNIMKAKAKDKYYNQYFQLYKENLKETWKLIGIIIKRKAKVQSDYSSRIIRNSKVYTNELEWILLTNLFSTSLQLAQNLLVQLFLSTMTPPNIYVIAPQIVFTYQLSLKNRWLSYSQI